MSAPGLRIAVHLHRHGRPVERITSSVTKLVWTRSITAPWSSLTVSWKGTVRDAFAVMSVGDWVVVRAKDISSATADEGPVIAWGHIDSINSGVAVDSQGVLATQETTIQATSWWALLQRVAIYAPKGIAEDVGTLLSMQTWSKAVAAVVQDYTLGSLAIALRKLLSSFAAVKLPETMGSLRLGDQIPLVHDEVSRKQYAPERVIDEVDIGGGLPNRLATMLGSYETRVSELLHGAFVPEPLLIELFPSFEPFSTLAQEPLESTENRHTPEAAPRAGFLSQLREFNRTGHITRPSPPPFSPEPPPASKDLANFLGGWESLIYRIKPFRTRPLYQSTTAKSEYRHIDTEKRAGDTLKDLTSGLRLPSQVVLDDIREDAENTAFEAKKLLWATQQGNILTNTFNKATWGVDPNDSDPRPGETSPAAAKFISHSLVRSITFERTDEARLNASSVVLSPDPSTGIEALAQFGLPITYDEEILRHGLRLLKPSWTFTLPEGGYDIVAYLRTVCAQFMQFYKNNHLFSSGQLSLNLLEATALRRTASQEVLDKLLYIRPGEVVAIELAPRGTAFYAYAESITHTFQVASGGIEAGSTSIKYSRGHFSEIVDDLVQQVEVPLGNGPAPSTYVSPVASAVSPVTTPPAPATSPSSVPSGGRCSAGRSVSAWPTSLAQVDFSKVPSSLVDWGEARGFAITESGTDYAKYQQVAIACAFVIEKYWKQIDPLARFSCTPQGGRRHGGPHDFGPAFDFYVKTTAVSGHSVAPVFQNWGALQRLVKAGRIPVGGRGLYLNLAAIQGSDVTDDPLVSPLLPEKASLTRTFYPPGGSAGAHYDIRGTFGFTTWPTAPRTYSPTRGDKWIAVDTTNDNRDDALMEAALALVHPDIAGYWRQDGSGIRKRNSLSKWDESLDGTPWDPFLDSISVGPTVPNALQMLGQTESCFISEIQV